MRPAPVCRNQPVLGDSGLSAFIKCFQLNCRKSPNVNAFVSQYIDPSSEFIGFLQEPKCINGALPYLPNDKLNIMLNLDGNQTSRAAIIANKNLNINHIPFIGDKDATIALLKTKVVGRAAWQTENVVLVSGYWDINHPNIPNTWEEAVKYAE